MSGDDGHRNTLRLAASGRVPIIGTVTDQRVEKWARWIDGPIRNNVLTMYLHRHAWQEMGRVVEGRDLPESYWWEFLVDTYVATQTMAIRRQADTHRDVASLAKVIQELRDEQRPALTRDRWVGLWNIAPDDDYEREHAARQWDENFGTGDDPTRLDPAIPAADSVALVEAARGMHAYADQHIAHSQANRASAQITLKLSDMHAVIDTIGELFGRYYSLLMAADYAILTTRSGACLGCRSVSCWRTSSSIPTTDFRFSARGSMTRPIKFANSCRGLRSGASGSSADAGISRLAQQGARSLTVATIRRRCSGRAWRFRARTAPCPGQAGGIPRPPARRLGPPAGDGRFCRTKKLQMGSGAGDPRFLSSAGFFNTVEDTTRSSSPPFVHHITAFHTR